MTELSRDAKELIALSRGGVDPSPADRERVRAKLAPAWSAQQRVLTADGFHVRRGAWMMRYGVWIALAWLSPSVPDARLQEAPVAAVSGEGLAAHAPSAEEPNAVAAVSGDRHGAITGGADVRRGASEGPEDRCARLASELRGTNAGAGELRAMRARFAVECPPASARTRTRASARASVARSDASACELAGVGSASRPECERAAASGACDGGGTGAGCKRDAAPCDASSGGVGCERAGACDGGGTGAGCKRAAVTCDASSGGVGCERASARGDGPAPCGGADCVRGASARARAVSSAADSGEALAAAPRDSFASTTSELRVRRAAPEQGGPSVELQPIDDELELLSSAQDALRRGQPSQALRLVQQHAFRFPRGALAQERSVVQALALCALDRRSAARVIIDDMKQRSPASPLLTSVRRACGL